MVRKALLRAAVFAAGRAANDERPAKEGRAPKPPARVPPPARCACKEGTASSAAPERTSKILDLKFMSTNIPQETRLARVIVTETNVGDEGFEPPTNSV